MKSMMSIVIVLGLFSINANANLSKLWVGTGAISKGKGNQLPCEKAVVNIEIKGAKLLIAADYTCGGQAVKLNHTNLTIQGTEILDNGKSVGGIGDQNIWIDTRDNTNEWFLKSYVDSDGVFHYFEYTYDGTSPLGLTGDLK